MSRLAADEVKEVVAAVEDIGRRLEHLLAELLEFNHHVLELALHGIELEAVGKCCEVRLEGVYLAADLAAPDLERGRAIRHQPEVRKLGCRPLLDGNDPGGVEERVADDDHISIGRGIGRVRALGTGDRRQFRAAHVLHGDALRLGRAGLGIDEKITRLDIGVDPLSEGDDGDPLLRHQRQEVEEIDHDILIARIDLAAGKEASGRERDLGRGGLGCREARIGLAAIDRILHHMVERRTREILHVVEIGGLQFLPVPENDGLFHVSVPSMPR